MDAEGLKKLPHYDLFCLVAKEGHEPGRRPPDIRARTVPIRE